MLVDDLAQIRISVPSDALEPLVNLLTEEGGGVEQRDGETLSKAASGRSEVVVWMAAEKVDARIKQVELLLSSLKDMGITVDPWAWESEEAKEEQWSEAYKEFFPVIHLGRFVVIKPTWRDYEPAGHEQVVEMDPGQAFGTGLHASTALMVKALERLSRRGTPPASVVDVGTGTGILAMAACKLWPEAEVMALDSDPVAVEVCKANLEANGLDGRVELHCGSVADLELPDGSQSLVLANLTRDLLLRMQPRLEKPLEEFGHLVVSGLLNHEAAEVCQVFSNNLSIEPEVSLEQGGWTAVIFRARS